MSVVYCKNTRRQFLVGAGNTLLALPLLPSLFSSVAQAQASAANDRKMMVFSFNHNILQEYWPQRSIATIPVGSSGSLERMMSTLPSIGDVSSLLTHPLYDTLRLSNQLSIVRGMDVLIGNGHGAASLGGRVPTSAGNLIADTNTYPTFDTIIESSLNVYPATTPSSITKAIRIDFGGGGYSFLRKVGTSFQQVPIYGFDQNQYFYDQKYYTLPVLYNDVFKSLTNGTTTPLDTTNQLKSNILNRVFESYKSFKANRKISSDDVSRVDQHMGFIADLQRSLMITAPPISSCTRPDNSPVTRDPLIFIPLYMDLLNVSFKCGLTKMGVMMFDGQGPGWLPNLNLPQGIGVHGAIHGGGTAKEWALKRNAHEAFNRYGLNTIAERFLTSLNVPEGSTGRTYLDNMATVILSEMGMESTDGGSGHSSEDMQQMIIGSMGGHIRAGRYIALPETYVNGTRYRLPYNAFIVTLLDLMGVSPNEYASISNIGQGWGYYNSTLGHPNASRYYQGLSELLV